MTKEGKGQQGSSKPTMLAQRIHRQEEQPAMIPVSRKRQRSADHDEHENNTCSIGRQQSSSSQIRKAATTIVATMLASSLSPAMAAEENLLHPGVHQPLYPATASDPTTSNKASTHISCQDDPEFVSTLGLSCRDHQQHGCKQTAIQELGYDLTGMVDLLQHCPVTCQLPPCENHNHDLIREEGHDQVQDEGMATVTATAISSQRSLLNSDDGSNPSDAAILEGQSVSSGLRGGNNPNQRAYPNMVHDSGVVSACFDGWHPMCQDDPYYVSKTGLPCEFHSSFDCSAWTNVGYTEMEVYDLINSCPCSCAVPCGTWTMEPSNAPSDMPSVSPTNFPTTSPTELPSASPSAPPTESPYCFNEQCIDDENYRSKNNLPCHLHGSLDCRAWGAVGYSLEEVFELINSCPCTCGIECGSYTHEPSASPSQSPSVSPTDLPSVSPSDVPTEMPSTSPTISNACYPGWSHYCQDDPDYRSPQGLRCAFHGSVDCYTWSEAGYSDEDILELIVSCPCSCKIPCGEVTFEPTPFPTMQPSPSPSAAPSSTPTMHPTRTPTLPPTPGPTTPKPTPRPTHPPTPAPTVHPTQSPTFAPSPSPTTAAPTSNPTESPYCFDDKCIDDMTWRSKNGMPCELHGSIHCLEWGSVGYSQQDIFELITACPCTCNIPCGTFTLNPTSSPTSAPSPSPTDEPTFRPTTSAPSHVPSATPTKRPSSTPSMTPSVPPTISAAPTVSQEPSASPTISFAPTISPRPTMWFEATARIANPIVEEGSGSIFNSIGFLIGVAVGGLGLIMLSVYGIYRYRVNNRGFSDTDDEEGGCFSCFRRNKGGVNINGKVEIMGLRRISKERPNREEIEERPFYSNLMNLIQPQQTKDHDEWNDTRWWGKGKQQNGGEHNNHRKDNRNRRSRNNGRGDRTYNSTPASILETPNAAATLFSCGVGENTLCRSAPTKGGGRDDMSQDSYNFTVETPFTNHTGRSSGRSSRQSSRYDDSTAAGDTYADNTYADNTYADDTYASRSTADSRNRRSRGKPSKSKSTSRSRSRRNRYDRYDQGTVESNTYADEEEFSEDSSYDD